MSRLLVTLLAGLLATAGVDLVPAAGVGHAVHAAPKKPAKKPQQKKKKPKKKKKKKKKGTKQVEAPPPPKPKRYDDRQTLAAVKAAGYTAARPIGHEEQAQGRAPLVVLAATAPDGRAEILVAAPPFGKGTKASWASVAVLAGDGGSLDPAAQWTAEVTPFLATGLVEVRLLTRTGDALAPRDTALHGIVRALPGLTEIACRFEGALSDGTHSRWIRVRQVQVRGATTLAFDLEVDEWGRERAGTEEQALFRYEITDTGLCRSTAMALEGLPHGQVTIGETKTIQGERDAAAVRQVVTARLGPALVRCYDEALRDDPKVAGMLILRLAITKSGRVDAVTIARDDTGYGAWSCATTAFAGLYFPSAGAPEDEGEAEDPGEVRSADTPPKQPPRPAQVDVAVTLKLAGS